MIIYSLAKSDLLGANNNLFIHERLHLFKIGKQMFKASKSEYVAA